MLIFHKDNSQHENKALWPWALTLVFYRATCTVDSPLTSKIVWRYRQIKIIKGPVWANLGGKELIKKIKNTTHQQFFCMENIHEKVHAITNSMENLRFDTEGHFHRVLLFYGLFYKRNRKHFSRVPIQYVIETLMRQYTNLVVSSVTPGYANMVIASIGIYSTVHVL